MDMQKRQQPLHLAVWAIQLLNRAYRTLSIPSVMQAAALRLNPGQVLLVELLLAGALMFLALGDKSIWWDESFSILMARRPWSEVWNLINIPVSNMALYYVLLHFWVKLGISETMVRSLSVIFALATLPVVYCLSARLFGTRAGLIATFLLSLNAFFIQYAQEARSYSLAILLVAVSSLLFVNGIHRPSRKVWILYALASASAVYAHYTAIFIPMAHFLSLIFLNPNRVPWRALIASTVSMAFLLLPILVSVFIHSQQGDNWRSKPEIIDIYHLYRDLAGAPNKWIGLAYIAPGIIALLWAVQDYMQTRLSFQTWRHAFVMAWLAIPVILGFIYSYLISPIFEERYYIMVLPAIVIFVALGVANIGKPWARALLLITLMAASAFGLWRWYAVEEKEQWREATTYVLAEAKPGDAITFYVTAVQIPFDYYLERLDAPSGVLEPVAIPQQYLDPNMVIDDSAKQRVDELAQTYSRLWLVISHVGIQDRLEQSQLIERSLQDRFSVVREKEFFKIRVLLYERSS